MRFALHNFPWFGQRGGCLPLGCLSLLGIFIQDGLQDGVIQCCADFLVELVGHKRISALVYPFVWVTR
jgi:hypothetical protein